jgi:hypothetical protein
VRSMLVHAGRSDDDLDIGLDTDLCGNPLHNDLDPYALAYAVATARQQSVRARNSLRRPGTRRAR